MNSLIVETVFSIALLEIVHFITADIGLAIAKCDINFKIQFELDKHFDINLINLFCKVDMRGIWFDKAVITLQCVVG